MSEDGHVSLERFVIWWTERGWVAVLQIELLIAGALSLVWLARWVLA